MGKSEPTNLSRPLRDSTPAPRRKARKQGPPTVAVLIDAATLSGSALMAGVRRYAEFHSWNLLTGDVIELAGVDGCIAHIGHSTLADQIRAAKLPAVNVSWSRHERDHVHHCNADGRSAGALAARFFLDHGHCRFGYFGPPVSPDHCHQFRQSFVSAVQDAGHECSILDEPGSNRELAHARRRLGSWLAGLTKPVAVMAFDAFLGKEVSEASVRIGIRIPDELALLCGDLDEAAHGDAATSLSGIDLNRHRIGYEAAVLLGKLLAGHKPRAPILIPPRGIQANRSTDALVFSDPVLLEALRFIRAKSGDPIQVSDIVDHVMVSRRLLESRFRDTLKRSPAAEIRRVRLDRSRRLLDGGLSVNDTAACSGFRYPEVFSRAFRREFGVSPSDYRLPGSQGR